MYEIGVIGQFEASHALVGDFGPATRIHGHTYRVEAIVRGARLRADGTLIDITVLQGALSALLGHMHYRDLNAVAGLEQINTTAENVADFIWEQLAPTLRGHNLSTLLVRVWENPSAWAAREDTLT
ncbi:MAG: 6-carboxytetrahydropterin synthase [Roseiflexaceae bacterium]|nr:6-carboxytetrahydropterin synthase [Roseiflexaceae bacterium]